MRGRALALTAAGVLALVAGGVLGATRLTSRWTVAPLPPAAELYRQALTARQMGQYGRANVLLRDAWAADPAHLVALAELTSNNQEVGLDTLLASTLRIAAGTGDSLFLTCVRIIIADTVHATTLDRLRASTNPLTRRCIDLLPQRRSEEEVLQGVARSYPESPALIANYVSFLVRRDPARAWEIAERLAGSAPHPALRAVGYAYGGRALHRLARHDEAAVWEREAEERARRWGPGALTELLMVHMNHAAFLTELRASDNVSRHSREVASRAQAELLALRPQLDAAARRYVTFRLATLLANERLNEALALFTELGAEADSLGQRHLQAYVHARIGRTLVKLGRLADAEPELRRACHDAEREGLVVALRECSHDLLHLHEARGRYDEAVAAGRDFVRYADLAGTMSTRMMGHRDLAWVHRRRGDLAAADAESRLMIADIDTMGTHSYYAGEYWELSGQLERARPYYLRSIQSTQDRARALAGLVRVNEALGDMTEARRYARIADRDTGTWHPEYTPLTPGLLARHGDLDEARRQYQLARAGTVVDRPQAFAQLALESAELELGAGDAASARILADSAAGSAALLGAGEIEVRARATSAVAALRLGSPADVALRALDSVVARADAMRVERLSATLHAMRGQALWISGAPDAALRAYARATAWVDSIATRIVADPSRASFRTTHLGVSNGTLEVIVATPGLPRRDAVFAAWTARRKGAAGSSDDLAASIATRIAAAEALVDYVVLDSTVAALVITRERATVVRIDVRPDTLREWVRRFRMPIAPRVGTAIDVSHLGFDEVTAHRLYRSLVEPVLPWVGGRTQLIVVPDGVLHMLPFDALVTRPGTGAARRYVLDDFTVRYAPGLGALERRTPRPAISAVAVGAPARPGDSGSTREIAMIARTVGGRVARLESSSTTATELRRAVEGATVVHFATHAEANDANPDHARLALPPDSAGERWLHAFEIREWKLDRAVVVLSACETGAGRIVGGEGTLSLSRAFFLAGASATLATLWPIGDPTPRLMEVFYRQIARGVPLPEALRAARLGLRSAGWSHPFYWAPFVLTSREL